MSKPGDKRRQPIAAWCCVCGGCKRVAIHREHDYKWACVPYKQYRDKSSSCDLKSYATKVIIWHDESPANELGEYSL